MPLSPIARLYRFLRDDGSLTVVVGILAVFLFALYPAIEVGALPPWSLDAAFALLLVIGATFIFEPRPIVKTFLALIVATALVRLAGQFAPSRLFIAAEAIAVMLTAGVFGALLISRVLRDGRINIHRIVAACGTFLLLGLVFAQAYKLLALFVPQGFAIAGTPVDEAAMHFRFTYFSFVTLTSTGYGDITPIHPYTRSLATFEAITGQLYLAVLIARLVALELRWRDAQRVSDPPPGPPAG
jgi:hypothetical protein